MYSQIWVSKLIHDRFDATEQDANERDARELFRLMVFNILIDNTDDQQKNHSLLLPKPFKRSGMRLAPACDILPTNSGQGFQEFVCGQDGRDSTLGNAMSECQAFGLSPQEAAGEAGAVLEVVNTWKAHFLASGVSVRDIELLEQYIDAQTLLSQRQQFDPAGIGCRAHKKTTKKPVA